MFAVSAGSPGSGLALLWRSTKATIVSTPTFCPRSRKAALPSASVVNEEVVAAALAPSRMKRTRAPANGCPNWSVTVATTIWLVPTTARVCLGARVTVLATAISHVTVTELEVGAGGAAAVTTDVPVTAAPKENTALPSEVGALPVVLPAPVTVKLTAVLSPTGIPPESVTAAATVAFPLTGARPPDDWVAPNRLNATWLGGPAQLAEALPVIEPDPDVTVAVMEDWPVAEELKEKVAAPELSLVRLPDVAPGPVTVKALDDGTIDVGLLFTGSSVIKPNYVLLQDDKGLQPADNPVAVIRKSVDTPDINAIIDKVNAALTVEEYNKLALQVQDQKLDPKDVAAAFLRAKGLA